MKRLEEIEAVARILTNKLNHLLYEWNLLSKLEGKPNEKRIKELAKLSEEAITAYSNYSAKHGLDNQEQLYKDAAIVKELLDNKPGDEK